MTLRCGLAAIATLLIAGPAWGNERILSIGDFDRVRVNGAFQVEIVTDKGPSGRIIGSREGIDRTSVTNNDRTLSIRPDTGAWSGWPGANTGLVIIRLTTPSLDTVEVNGASAVTISRMRGAALHIGQTGSGSVRVSTVSADRITIASAGAGTISVAGRVAQLDVITRGSGAVDGAALAAQDVTVTSEGSGDTRLAASRSARVTANGSGNVTVAGKPACTVKNQGSGTVVCGAK